MTGLDVGTKLDTSAVKQRQSALAERLKALRLQKGWTQGQAGQASGISVSALSKIENGLVSPTYDVLLRLAYGLGVDIAELFVPAEAHMGAGRRSIERAGQGEIHETPLYLHRLLCSQLAHKRMMPFRTRIKVHEGVQTEGWSRHEGEEFVYVLEGEIELHTEYYQPVTLFAGDCFYIDSRMRHQVVNKGTVDAEVLWVSTTPDVRPPEIRA
ncbi:XRE family transcriptional regulator [Castellaniella sp. MT123]|uniref:helix-turn-helix domain-containing protein n=1 Tax=Castellaniella sp. MT123 TaxID=3140381 RepID=UPI0031F43AFD